MRKRLVDLIGGRDDIVWTSLQTLADHALSAAGVLERRLHHGTDEGAAGRELASTALRSDDTLRHLNRHLHNAFTSPLERDDALALGSACDRVAHACADIGATLDARSEDRGRHEARRAGVPASGRARADRAGADRRRRRRDSAEIISEARGSLGEARRFIRQGLGDVLDAGLLAGQLLWWKDICDRLDLAVAAARDAERLVYAIA